MDNKQKKQKAAEIAEKYQFSAMNSWSERKVRAKFKELFSDLVALEIENAVLTTQLEHIKKAKQEDPKPNIYDGYDRNWTGVEKVVFVLKRKAKPMLTKEVERELLTIEPELTQKWKDTFACVSNYMYRALKFSRIERLGKIGDYGFQYKVARTN